MSERRSPGEEESERERCVLLEVLELFPITLTADELIRAWINKTSGIGEAEPWERAIRELRGHGLLRLDDEAVVPTMAAIRAYELLDQ
jgi:hypothetical protein